MYILTIPHLQNVITMVYSNDARRFCKQFRWRGTAQEYPATNYAVTLFNLAPGPFAQAGFCPCMLRSHMASVCWLPTCLGGALKMPRPAQLGAMVIVRTLGTL